MSKSRWSLCLILALVNTVFATQFGDIPVTQVIGSPSIVNDSNITLTLGGTPTDSLLKSFSLTVGWSGLLPVSRGGTGSGTTSGALSALGGQPLDGDLTALAALTGTNTIYYRSAADTWTPVTIGGNMSFSGGVLNSVAGGSGTVTSFSAGDLSPLFTTTEATVTTTPALSFTLSTAAANTVFGNNTASTAAPVFSSSPRFTAIGNLTTNGFVKTGGGIGTLSVDTSTYLTSNQSITLSGDVTGTGTTAITTAYNNAVPATKAGVPTGGTAGQVLSKIDATNYNTQWVAQTSGGAPTTATYITQTPDGTLSAEQALSALATGLVKNTTGTGVLSIATAGTDYLSPATGVTTFASGNLSPLFTVTPSSATSGAISQAFTLSTAAANTVFGNNTASTAAPVFSSSPRFTAIGNLTTNGFVKTGGGVGTLSVDTNTYLTGNQTITLTGAATGSGTTSIATTVNFSNLTGNWTLAQGPSETASTLLGRGSASAGVPQEITLGTNLSMSGTTLNATGGGSGSPGGSNTYVQFNDSGAFGGDSQFLFDKSTGKVTFKNGLSIGIGPISSGAWIDLPTSGPSGIGTGGAGSNPFLAYVSGSGNWFTETASGDIAIRNASGNRIYLGITGATGGYATASVSSTAFELSALQLLGFSSTSPSNGVIDLALYRNAAGLLEINNGTPGTLRDLTLRNLTVTGTCTGCGGGGGGTPGGSDTQVQYNNAGAFGGINVTTFDGAIVTQLAGSGPNTKYYLADPTTNTKKANFDLSNIASATTRTVNIPNANSTTAQANAGGANLFFTSMSAQGVFSTAQPQFTDLGGTISTTQGAPLLSDTAFASSWNAVTTQAPTKNAVYDQLHLFDTDDDGKVDVLDQVAGITNTNASGVIQTPITAPTGAIVGTTDTQTLTNKRINPRVDSSTSGATATWSPNCDTTDVFTTSTVISVAVTTINNPSGTPVDGQKLMFRFKSNGSANALTWSGTNYRASTDSGTPAFPTATNPSKTTYVGVQWNATDSKWDLLAVQSGF